MSEWLPGELFHQQQQPILVLPFVCKLVLILELIFLKSYHKPLAYLLVLVRKSFFPYQILKHHM